jgi:S-adenosylmethionine:tRNA ribosyltransferase-isomerase
VGTTTVRALEGAYLASHGIQPFRGWTDVFIYPGFIFNVVDHMLTNFHLPRSSLLMMVSAFAGRETVLRAYREAKNQDFRFYSYGDSMFIF